MATGQIEFALVFAGFPHADPPKEWLDPLSFTSRRVVFTLFEGRWTEGAEMTIPSATPFEKEGSWVNEDGILQRVRSKDNAGEGVTTELKLLQDVQVRLGERHRILSSAGVFRELAEAVEGFHGLTHRAIPAHGTGLPGFSRERVGSTGGGSP